MKKIVTFLMVLVMGITMTFTLSACSDSKTDSDSSTEASKSNLQNPPDDSKRPVNEEAKTLVVYFSVPDDEDNSYVEIDGERLGNTQYMAYVIQENTDANIFRILPKNPYPTDHDALLEVAQEEIRTDARPEIEGTIEDFDSYDIHGGGGFSGTQETIAELEQDAAMLEGKSISRNSIEDAEQEIIDWLDDIGMLKDAD